MSADGIRNDDEPAAVPANEWGEAGNEPLETEQLALDDEERLPWLESADEDDDQPADGGRILGFAVLGAIALALLVGAIWFISRRGPDSAVVADGSTIAAPAQPYKERPKDAGGKQFDGTGDSAFAVSEGQTRPAQMAPASPTPKPSAGPAKSSAAAAPSSAGVGVQVAAYSTQALAEAGWGKLVQQYSALSGVPHRVVSGKADIGTVYRLQAVPGDAAAANALCGRLKSAGLSCQVK